VSFLSLFLAIDDDEMVVVMPIALFFSRSSMIVRADEKEKPSSRIRAIIIRILPREKEKRIVFCTSTDCTSFIVSFTGPVTSATEIAFAIFKRLLLLLLLVLDFFLNFKVVGEEMNALVVDIVMDTIFLFVFFYSLVFF
jgi:hypothetical protein